jgi:hypothetical protein
MNQAGLTSLKMDQPGSAGLDEICQAGPAWLVIFQTGPAELKIYQAGPAGLVIYHTGPAGA